MKEKKMKMNKDSKLIISEEDGTEIVQDIFGNQCERVRVKRYIAEGEISLGSIANPNKKIISYRYDVPDKKGIGGRI